MNLIDLDGRDGYIYDAQIKGMDANFWAQLTGTTTKVSNLLQMNVATMASFVLHEYCQLVIFKLNVVTAPTAGHARRWGFFSPQGTADVGGIYFDITGTVFSVKVVDDQGNTAASKTITWDAANWSNVQILYAIKWEKDVIQFWTGIPGTPVAWTLQATFIPNALASDTGAVASFIPSTPLPVYVSNSVADNFTLGYLLVRKSAGIV